MSRTMRTCPTRLRLVSKEGRPCYGKLVCAPTRRLVLVDIENYCGKGVLCPEDIRTAKEEISRDLTLLDDDLVVIGTSHGKNCLVCGTEWRGPRQVLRSGHDGADIALIEASQDYVLDTFSSVVIVSGDGIFTDLVSAVRTRRKRVTVVSGRGRLSHRLQLAASVVKHCDPQFKPAA